VTTAAQILTAGVALLANTSGAGIAVLRGLCVATLALTVTSALHYVYVASTRGPGQPPAGAP